jgi:hypothetical protein
MLNPIRHINTHRQANRQTFRVTRDVAGSSTDHPRYVLGGCVAHWLDTWMNLASAWRRMGTIVLLLVFGAVAALKGKPLLFVVTDVVLLARATVSRLSGLRRKTFSSIPSLVVHVRTR